MLNGNTKAWRPEGVRKVAEEASSELEAQHKSFVEGAAWAAEANSFVVRRFRWILEQKCWTSSVGWCCEAGMNNVKGFDQTVTAEIGLKRSLLILVAPPFGVFIKFCGLVLMH
ncbi:MAG: hypothetical protein ACKEQI_00455 [Candidatus Hodgkinia cicadicola]